MEFDIDSFFKKASAFRNVSPKELSLLALKSKTRPYKKLEYIFHEGDPAQACWWVASGLVKISKLSPDGRMSTMEILTPGDIFAPAGVMNIQCYPANAIAVSKTMVVSALKPDISPLARAYPSILQNVLEEVSQRLQHSHQLRVFDSTSSEKKVAAALLWLFKKTGKSSAVSRREIAEIASVAHETAIRAILKMTKNHWLQTQGRTILISNSQALQSFIDQE